jgi:type VI protein secretion system component Hcp
MLLLAVGAAGGGAALAVASVPDGNGKVHACYLVTTDSGQQTVPVSTGPNFRIIDPNATPPQTCHTVAAGAPLEGTIDFNTIGVQGLQGAPGQTGPRGLQGPPGVPDTLTISGSSFQPSATDAPIGGVKLMKSDGSTLHSKILSFSFGQSNSGSCTGAGAGAGAGKVKFNEFTIKKTTDSASPAFFRNCVAGAHYKQVIIVVRKAGGDGKYLLITGTDGRIVSFTTFSHGSTGASELDEIKLTFRKIEVTTPVKVTGIDDWSMF